MSNVIKTKRKKNIWDDNYRPYGVNEGAYGNPSEWKQKYERVMGLGEAKEIVKERSPWTILGVAFGATLQEIKSAFRKMALKVHPDHGGTEDAFRDLYASYIILTKSKN